MRIENILDFVSLQVLQYRKPVTIVIVYLRGNRYYAKGHMVRCLHQTDGPCLVRR